MATSSPLSSTSLRTRWSRAKSKYWRSNDGGQSWSLLSTPETHSADTNRMNHAAGLCGNGDLLLVTSGWDLAAARAIGDGYTGFVASSILPQLVCRSADGGETWKVDENPLPAPPPNCGHWIPCGDVVSSDGVLGFSAYAVGDGIPDGAYFLRSFDDGATWHDAVPLAPEAHNETAILALAGGFTSAR